MFPLFVDKSDVQQASVATIGISTVSTHAREGGKQDHLLISGCGVSVP